MWDEKLSQFSTPAFNVWVQLFPSLPLDGFFQNAVAMVITNTTWKLHHFSIYL
jgi:hypothetical protein